MEIIIFHESKDSPNVAPNSKPLSELRCQNILFSLYSSELKYLEIKYTTFLSYFSRFPNDAMKITKNLFIYDEIRYFQKKLLHDEKLFQIDLYLT